MERNNEDNQCLLQNLYTYHKSHRTPPPSFVAYPYPAHLPYSLIVITVYNRINRIDRNVLIVSIVF